MATETGNVSVRFPSLFRRVLESSRSSKNLRFIATPRFPGGRRLREYINNYSKNRASVAYESDSYARLGCEMRASVANPRGLAGKVLRITSFTCRERVEPVVQKNASE